MSTNIKFGKKNIPFVYKGDKLVYPNPIKDGLLLWYDFKGMRNTDTNKEVAKDLSGNGNHGTLTNFNFSEESGYKDNTLVFDGVDDSLTIPELELDETAMSVMHDGKLYAYEDDKVLIVGEDGEIIGGGVNLLPSFYDSAWYKRQSDFAISPYHLRSAKGVRQATIATIVLDVKPNTDYTIFVNTDLGRTRVSSDSGSGAIMGYQNGDFSRVFNTGDNESVEVELGVFSGNVGEEINFSNVMLCQGRLTQRSFTPAPEDFQTTSLSPLSLSNLQLYNRSLRKNELLHNAESKGLKELVNGVPVQDGLVLHYDFSHESNNSEYKGKAFDYSGNGNHGELQNFNFTDESGYDGNKLKFDGVDDFVGDINIRGDSVSETYTFVVRVNESKRNNFLYAGEELKIDLYYNRITRADVNPSLSIRHNAGYETFYGVLVKDGLEHTTYINGVVVDKSILNSVKSSRLMNIGSYVPQGRPSIDLFDLKAYNRPLTAEEIQHNYQIEKEKYNIVEGEM